jgi:threonine synthase
MYEWNDGVTGLVCLRCGGRFPVGDFPTGCPSCMEEGFPASLTMQYSEGVAWDERVPFRKAPFLGEGGTPVVELQPLAEELGVERFALKQEYQNPTGSHKDRFSPYVAARALQLGKEAVVLASSGNAGVSMAAYAARVGLRCIVIMTDDVHQQMREAVSATGAEILMVGSSMARWKLMRELVESEGYYPATNYVSPPVGSNLYGVQGYKRVAYELVRSGERPTAVVVPTSRADLLWGIWEGFRDAHAAGVMERLPRMFSVEPFPRLHEVLAGRDYRGEFPGQTGLTSIAGSTVTYQGVLALRESGGQALVVNMAAAEQGQRKLAAMGLLMESSSATIWPAVQQLAATGKLIREDRVVAIGTSHGFKKL